MDVKAVSSKVQVPPLLCKYLMQPSGYFISHHLSLTAFWVWDPWYRLLRYKSFTTV